MVNHRENVKINNYRFYYIWIYMRRRCTKPNCNIYKYYGGRGIKVCDRWMNSFDSFKEDMWDTYDNHVYEYGEKNTSLDRINNDGDYSKENCRWSTRKMQAQNRRKSSKLTKNGVI